MLENAGHYPLEQPWLSQMVDAIDAFCRDVTAPHVDLRTPSRRTAQAPARKPAPQTKSRRCARCAPAAPCHTGPSDMQRMPERAQRGLLQCFTQRRMRMDRAADVLQPRAHLQ